MAQASPGDSRYMSTNTHGKRALSTTLARDLLEGRRKPVIWGWGSKRDFTTFEWQRQIKAEFMVDFNTARWKAKNFHGLALRAPNAIKKLDSEKTLIFNNYYYTPASAGIESFLNQLGAYRICQPLTLQEIICFASSPNKKYKQMPIQKSQAVDQIIQTLSCILTPPVLLNKLKQPHKWNHLAPFFCSYKTNEFLQAILPRLHEENAARLRPKPGHVCLMIGALHPGGAERQLCNLAFGLKKAGWSPTVLVYETGTSETAHYQNFLSNAGIDYTLMGNPASDPAQYALSVFEGLPNDIMAALWHLRGEFVLRSALTYKTLCALRPELLISYLEWPNIFSSIGGLMAGVPRIAMSGRMMAPPNFPHFYGKFTQSFKDIYKIALRQPDVFLNNNSPAGAKSYATWTGLPYSDIKVVPNSVSQEFTKPVALRRIAQWRTRLGLKTRQPFILGVFRISQEKNPLDFVRVIAALQSRIPNLKAAICGHDGDMADQTRKLIDNMKMNSIISLMGVVEDIPVVMRIATLLLHTSEIEGFPNVILEAQAVGLPVVCTKNSGAHSFVHKSWRPFMRQPGNIKGLVHSCERMIHNHAKNQLLARKARQDTLKLYSIEQTVRATLNGCGYPHVR